MRILSTIGIFGVPLLSGISTNVGSSGFSAYDLFADNGVDFNVKLRNAVFSSTRNDKVAINEQIEIFNGGFKIAGQKKVTPMFRLECIRI